MALYDGEIAYVDAQIGRLLDWLRTSGLEEDTLVVIVSDHGAGPTSGPRVRLNNMLAEAGLLTWGKGRGGIGTDLISSADRFLRRTLFRSSICTYLSWLMDS